MSKVFLIFCSKQELKCTELELTIALFLNDDGVQTVRIDLRPVHVRHGHVDVVSRAIANEVASLHQYVAAKSSPLVCIAHTSLRA